MTHDVDHRQSLEEAWARHKRGDVEYAYREYQRLLRQRPHDARALHYLGLLAQQTGHPQTAIELMSRSIAIDQSDPKTFNHLGQIFAYGRQFQAAERCFRCALDVDPNFSHALNNLANVLRKQARHAEALELYRRAIALDPQAREARYNLGKALRDMRAFPDALQEFERAIEADPSNHRACYELALCLEELGRFGEAEKRYLQALQIKSDHARSIANLLALRTFVPDDGFVARATELAADARVRDEERAKLHQGIGKYYDGRRDYERAFSDFAASNAVQRKWTTSFDTARAAAQVRALTEPFDAAHFAAVRAFGHVSRRPIFIVGMPRSGTTLVEQILASHPQVYGGGELTEIPKIARELINAREPAAIEAAALRYLEHLAQNAPPDAVRVTDKLPINYRHLGVIATLFPQACIVHCRRDPRDVALSCFIEMFNIRDQDFTDLEGIAHAIVQQEQLMSHWRRVLPTAIHEVSYEKLIASQEDATRALLEYCGLPWDDRCLVYFKTERNVDTPSRWQVRQAIYRSSVGRWRNYASQLQPALAILQSAGMTEAA